MSSTRDDTATTPDESGEVGQAPAPSPWRYAVIAAVVVTAFLSSLAFATSRVAPAGTPAGRVAGRSAAASGGSTCACCSGGSAEVVKGAAAPSGNVQKVTVSTSSGSWSPNEITVRAGTPVEITFQQGEGCLAQVAFDDFGIVKDLTRGGAVVRLPALKAGEYAFHCGMNMAFGKIVAR